MNKTKTPRRRHRVTTIVDVAKAAGVSTMTVSRVINDEDKVKEKTREKVKAAIAQIGYVPNSAARNLASANPIHIGLLYSNPSSAYLSEFLLGALEKASQNNIQLVVENIDSEVKSQESIRLLIKRGIDGILLPPPLSDSSPVLDLLLETETPSVIVASGKVVKGVSVVRIDDFRAAYDMTKYILSLGHERIGFIVGDPSQISSRLRLSGFRAAMQDRSINVEDSMIVQGDFSYRSGLKAAQRLLSLPNRPTAIFASNDDMAAAAVASAHSMHLDVPNDVGICGFDNTAMATTIWPELTTIDQPIKEMSSEALDLLIKKIKNRRSQKEEKSGHIELDYTLIKRQSLGNL